MTSTPFPTLAAATDGDQPDNPPPGAFVRLAAFDGLFLRSEHLNLMEDYAASLALSVAEACGPGVVYGFEVTLSGSVLSVSPGLAVMSDGRPVRSTGVLTLDIPDLASGSGTFYRVGLMWGTWPFGEEPVQGLLCDAGCGCDGTSTHTSRQAEGPFVTIREADDVPTFTAPGGALRSWIASELFRTEEERARRWPATDHVLPTRWTPNAEQPRADTLPLAVLIAPTDGVGWQVDTWAARRDRGSPPPSRHWQWHLGMRPRDVFVAQVLQFQDHLEDVERARAGGSAAAAVTDQLRKLVEAGRGPLPKGAPPRQDGAADHPADQGYDLEPALTELIAQLATSGKGSGSPGRAFVELPPAGFVRGTGQTAESVRLLVESRLGCPDVVNRVCQCAPGDVGRLFEAAQHRDRTRTPVSADFDRDEDTHVIDVFVPVRGGAPVFDWVLFTRAEAVQCEEAEPATKTDPVEVVHEVAALEGPGRLLTLGTLQYPPSTWAVPADPKGVFESVQKVIAETKGTFALRAQVDSEDRRPLGHLRAALLAGPFVEGEPSAAPQVETSVAPGAEKITLVTYEYQEVGDVAPRRAAAKAAAAETVADDDTAAPAAAGRAASRRSTARKAPAATRTTTRATSRAKGTAPSKGTTSAKGTSSRGSR